MCHVSTKIFNSIETHQLHIVNFKGVMCHVSTKIFNSIETQQLHIVNFKGVMCHVSTKFSIFNSQLSNLISICKYLIYMVRQPGLRYSRLVLV